MKPEQKASMKTVRGFLLLDGMTVEGFCEKHGYKPDTVRKVIRRYVVRGGTTAPKGDITCRILRDLAVYCPAEIFQS